MRSSAWGWAAHVGFLVWIAAAAGLMALVAYRVLTDTSVPLFGGS